MRSVEGVTLSEAKGHGRARDSFPPLGMTRLWMDAFARPGWMNMAIDSALLERAEAGEWWLRLYAWEPACLSFGRHEPAARRYDADRITGLGLSVVRRPTGGRAVWHARELTYAVAGPIDGLGTLSQVYGGIHAMLRDALRALGAPAELAPMQRSAPVDAGACFSSPAGGEVMVAGRKVVGSAQLRRGAAFLQHGSVLLEDDQAMVAQVTRGIAPPDRSAPLSRYLGRPARWAEVAEAVAEAVAAAADTRWGRGVERVSPPASLLEGARRHGERFRSAEWTWAGTTRA